MALNVFGKAERSQRADPVPVHVEFIPRKPVARRLRNRVMIVVPALAESKYGNPKTVFGGVVRQEPPRTPHVCRGVYQPSGVQADHDSHKHSPQEKWQSADGEECYATHRERYPVPFADPELKFVLPQVGNIGQEFLGAVVHRFARHNPTHVRPQAAIARRMRIAFFVGVLVMHPMRAHPGERSAFESRGAADGQEIFHPLWRFVAAVSQQAVVAHANAKASGDPPEKSRKYHGFPGEKEQRGDRADMKCKHEKGRGPINRLRKSFVVA